MNRSTDSITDIDTLVAALPNRPEIQLRLAAQMVEAAAYALAGNEPAENVASLILMSARLERLAEDLKPRAESLSSPANSATAPINVVPDRFAANQEKAI